MESESQKDPVKLKVRIRQILICVEIRGEKRATTEGYVGGALGTQMGSPYPPTLPASPLGLSPSSSSLHNLSQRSNALLITWCLKVAEEPDLLRILEHASITTLLLSQSSPREVFLSRLRPSSTNTAIFIFLLCTVHNCGTG